MPEDEGPVSFGYAVTKSIMRAEEAMATNGDITRAVASLRRLIGGWCKNDSEFKKRMERVDDFCALIKYLQKRWPRLQLPSWQGIVLQELVNVARENRLLDIRERAQPQWGEELLQSI